MSARWFLPLAAAATAAAIAIGNAVRPDDTRPAEWKAQEGSSWRTYASAYHAGWTHGCRKAVRFVLDAEDDVRPGYRPSICRPPRHAYESPAVPIEPPSDPANAGYELGLLEGCVEALAYVDVPRFAVGDYGDSHRCPAALGLAARR